MAKKRQKRAKGKQMSQRQQRMLQYISEYIQDAGRPPTIREIGTAAEISSTSVVNYNLTKLAEKGYIDRDSEVSRGLRLTEKAKALYGAAEEAVERLIRVPLLGNIVASEPVEVFDINDEDDAIELSRSLFDDKAPVKECGLIKPSPKPGAIITSTNADA